MGVLTVAVSLAVGESFLVHRQNEACTLNVRGHLAMLTVSGPGSDGVCARLLASHPAYWETYVQPRVQRMYNTPANNIALLCEGKWEPRLYRVYDVNYGGVFPGSYGTELCSEIDHIDPAVGQASSR